MNKISGRGVTGLGWQRLHLEFSLAIGNRITIWNNMLSLSLGLGWSIALEKSSFANVLVGYSVLLALWALLTGQRQKS